MLEDKPKLAAIVLGGFVLIVGALLLLGGGRSSTILSTIGAPIPDNAGAGQNASGGSSGGSGDAGSGGSAGGGQTGPDVVPAAETTLLIVRTGTLTLETTGIAASVSDGARIVSGGGGFVAASKESGTGAEASAVVEYRIPAAAWEPTLAGLRGLGTISDQDIKSEEVTGAVADLGARISNLRATEASLQAIMAKATRIQDVLDVEKELTTTRGQIEELVAQESGLRDRAAFGTLTVTFRLPAPAPTPAPTPRAAVWDPARDAAAASSTLVRIGQSATSVGIWVAIVAVPLLLVATIGVALGWGSYRLVTRRRRRAAARI
ncbi:MAG TPA: DUF4349 domain-containing protein [Candidatus Limnocylindrales bacterium]|nr:DUF4349 domain-containing protein [Candidatus Limnocylindrales bacterium]